MRDRNEITAGTQTAAWADEDGTESCEPGTAGGGEGAKVWVEAGEEEGRWENVPNKVDTMYLYSLKSDVQLF